MISAKDLIAQLDSNGHKLEFFVLILLKMMELKFVLALILPEKMIYHKSNIFLLIFSKINQYFYYIK